MTEATEEGIRLVRTAEGAVELWEPAEQRLIKTSVRAGAWGVGGGAAVMLVGTIGMHLPLHWLWVGLGLTGGGLASVIGSAVVLRKVWKGRLRHLKAAGALGIPFGLSAAVLGVGWLSRDMGVMAVTSWATPVLLILGIGLIALFGSGAVKHFWQLLRAAVDEQE